ncbi:ArsR/SmtB family transcription factor [Mucisphaera calidilacus]|nr:metalloregulator ArsR/SmtB family transcription factor [Mucisphaera calidilacus]
MSCTQPTTDPLPMGLLEQAADALRVLAHPHRLKIVEILLQQRLTVGQLATELRLPQAAVSGHLTQMRAHDLLRVEREGRTAYYRICHPAAHFIINCLTTHRDQLSIHTNQEAS